MGKKLNRIFISIGVSKPGGGLDELPGAITAAERMAAWAESQGYVTLLLHDGVLPEITTDVLRVKITEAINRITDHAELERLVIFFAGHGAALAIGDQYWILTNWQKRTTEAIKVSSLQRMLEYYGPRQVSVIGDACQEFSSKFIDLIGSAVLDMPDEEQRPYELDQFFAVDAGKQAFMIKATGETKAFCLFTEILLDALEGEAGDSGFEVIDGAKVVTSQSLARHIAANVTLEASKYGVRMNPRPIPGFYTDRSYLTIPIAPKDAPPSSASKASRSRGVVTGDAEGPIMAGTSSDGPARKRGARLKQAKPRIRSTGKAQLVRSRTATAELELQIQTQARGRESSRQAFVTEVASHTVRDHFETGCGICVSGADVTNVRASFGQVSNVDNAPNWFRINLETSAGRSDWSDTLVTLTDGRIVSVCAVGGFVAALHIIDDKSLSLFHRPIGAADYEGNDTINLLAQAHAGLLSREEIIDTAAMLREGKHRIITLGCIVAQFYDAIRDVESLRSIAAFYAMKQQPVPLDIILYGGGTLSDHAGRLYADIPEVARREPRTDQERRQIFTYEHTPGFEKYPVAGRIPWMRQAWGAVATANCHASAVEWRKQALNAMTYLAPGSFTIARPEGRVAFEELAGIGVKNGNEPEIVKSTS